MIDDGIKALEAALAAGPTPGPWTCRDDFDTSAESWDLYGREDGRYLIGMVENANGHKQNHANVMLIAAAHPERIARLVAEVKRLRQEQNTKDNP